MEKEVLQHSQLGPLAVYGTLAEPELFTKHFTLIMKLVNLYNHKVQCEGLRTRSGIDHISVVVYCSSEGYIEFNIYACGGPSDTAGGNNRIYSYRFNVLPVVFEGLYMVESFKILSDLVSQGFSALLWNQSIKANHMEHELKCESKFFKAIVDGKKQFEVRKNDRDFKVNDTIILNEIVDGVVTGMAIRKVISYILPGGQYGIDKDYIVMGLN